jgi:putative zinc finger/helix-turn-helix YgiT family protein
MERCVSCSGLLQKRKHTKPYHYTESGLNNVFLEGVKVLYCSACDEELVELEDVPGLHAKIAEILLRKPFILTGPELRFLRKEMRMKAKDLAIVLGVTPTTVSRWETGDERLGVANDRLIRSLYFFWLVEQGKIIDPKSILDRVATQFPTIKSKPKAFPIRLPVGPGLAAVAG